MIISCSPLTHPIAVHGIHRLAHRLRHTGHHVVGRTSKAVHHVFKTAISPRLTAGFACKMGSAAIVAGGLMTALPANTPLGSARASSLVDGAARSSTTSSENSGALEQASSLIWVVGPGSAGTLPEIAPDAPAPYVAGDSPTSSNPFASRGPLALQSAQVARDLTPVLNELPAGLDPGVSGSEPDSQVAVSVSASQVDEPSSGFILLAASIALTLRRATMRIVCRVAGRAGLSSRL